MFGERPVLFQECLLSLLLGLDFVVGVQTQDGHSFLVFFSASSVSLQRTFTPWICYLAF